MKKKKHKKPLITVLLSLLLIAVAAFLVLGLISARKPGSSPIALFSPPVPEGEAAAWLEAQRPVYEGASPLGQRIAEALNRAWSCRTEGELSVSGDRAQQEALVTQLRLELFTEGLEAEVQQALETAVAGAARRSEIYDDSGAYLPELLEQSLCAALDQRSQELAAFTREERLTVKLQYAEDHWQVETQAPEAETAEPDALGAELLARCAEAAVPVPLHYAIPEDLAVVPPAPEENYHVSRDPLEIAALLDSPEARALIDGRELVWNPELELLEDSEICLYLDETLLVIVWQQVEDRPVATFSEVIVADGSQLRRKIGGDSFGCEVYRTTSQFAQDCNAVLTLGGDYYWHFQRSCGISVLDGQIARFRPQNADSCFITRDGDMLFVYQNQYKENQQAECQQFIDDNDVIFSLAFGPVLIDDGKDVTPDWYRWGEIDERYARSALGMLGEKHYLSVNLNCTNAHYYLATLQDATDALLSRGCVKAYTLDGGQTATTVFQGRLINPVQFGWEKPISDVIYFASALPGEE